MFCVVFVVVLKRLFCVFFVSFFFLVAMPLLLTFNAYFYHLNQIDALNDHIKLVQFNVVKRNTNVKSLLCAD